VTASCLVFDPIADSVLLNHHGKAQLWGQFGGHLEPVGVSLRAAAQREAEEESGLTALSWVSSAPIDLHVHDLSTAFGTCTRHYDGVVAARASVSQSPTAPPAPPDAPRIPLSGPPPPAPPPPPPPAPPPPRRLRRDRAPATTMSSSPPGPR